MFTFFEHTADLGIRIEAKRLDELFTDAANALTSALVEEPESIKPRITEDVSIIADDVELLLFDWLRELLLRFETRHMLFSRFLVAIEDHRLTATIHGEPIDHARHPLSHEVKAITYHGLSVQKVNDGWVAEVIVDI